MVPREVPTIATPRVPITVTPPRVPVTVTTPRVMTPRVPMISQEDPVEDIRQRDTGKDNSQHQLKHIYPTRITQLYQEINQVDSIERTMTNHDYLTKMANGIIDDDTGKE